MKITKHKGHPILDSKFTQHLITRLANLIELEYALYYIMNKSAEDMDVILSK